MFHTSSNFQTPHCSSVSTWPQYHNQLDGELPRYTAKSRPYEIQSQEKKMLGVHKSATIMKIMFIRELQEKLRSLKTWKLEETHIPAEAVCTAAGNIIAPTANNKIHSIITARCRAPFGLQNNPNNIHNTAKKYKMKKKRVHDKWAKFSWFHGLS